MCREVVQKWEELYQTAVGQSGYFTTAQAHEAGYSDQLLGYHSRQGRVQRVVRGVYRLVHFPSSEREDLMALWLWSDREGVFSHETALTLHQLSDTMPSLISMTFPLPWKKRRMRYPRSILANFATVNETDRTWIGSVPVTSALRTVKDCRTAHMEPDLVAQATSEALERGLFRVEALEHG